MVGNLVKDFMTTNLNIHSILIVALVLFISCRKDKNQENVIPNVNVDFEINLNNPDYLDLSLDGGYVYVNGGYNGILIYRENASVYKAFERACTYQPNSDCATIQMDVSQLFLTDTCCKSQFDFNGSVISGVAPNNLKQYQSQLNDNYLRVTN